MPEPDFRHRLVITARNDEPTRVLGDRVRSLQSRLSVDVCSIYLLGADRAHLVLAATVGLREDSVRQVRMDLREGLAGMVAQQMQPVVVTDVQKHPRFKYFSEAGEEPYHAFLGVPVVGRGLLHGVLIVQTVEQRVFSHADVAALVAAAAELGPIVAEVRNRDQFIAPLERRLWALALNLWWSWDASCVSLFRDLNPVRWRELGRNPVALLSEMPLDVIDRRVRELVLSHRIHHAYRRLQEYLGKRLDVGRDSRGSASGAPRRLLLDRVRHSRIPSRVLGRPRRTGR